MTLDTKQHEDAVVEVDHLRVTYDDGGEPVTAIDDISLRVERGERVAVIGPSGSGKTSLIRVLSGLRAPSDGRVVVGRHHLTGGTIEREMARDIGQVFQGFGLVPQLSALQNVLCGRLYEYPGHRAMWRFSDADKGRAAELLEGLGLGDRANQRTSKLSGGEQQRVGVARLLFQAPEIALLDEPISNLDVHWAAEVMEQLGGTQNKPSTVIMVLHDLGAVRRWADRAIFMLDGKIVFDGNPDEACARLENLEGGVAGSTHLDGTTRASDDQPGAARPEPAPRPSADDIDGPGLTKTVFYGLAFVLIVGAYIWSIMGVNLTASKLFGGLGSAGSFLSRLFPPDFSVSGTVFDSLVETVQMALIGTTLAAFVSLPISVLAARNVSPGPIRTAARILLNLLRTVPSIIWGLFFVAMVGLGPLPGILALTFYASGYLGKFYYEGIESISPGPVRALKTTGASRLQQFRHGVFPQVLPLLAGYTLYMFEYNVRAASILGVVGAGGIGFYLYTYINNFNYAKATTALLFLLVIVTVIDMSSSWLRERLQSA
jgi:phosphonate transport system permease protein